MRVKYKINKESINIDIKDAMKVYIILTLVASVALYAITLGATLLFS